MLRQADLLSWKTKEARAEKDAIDKKKLQHQSIKKLSDAAMKMKRVEERGEFPLMCC